MFINPFFWIALFLCTLGYFLYRFGMISRGANREVVRGLGGVIALVSFPVSYFMVDWLALIALIALFMMIVTPAVEMVVSSQYKRLYADSDARIAKKFGTTAEDVQKHTYAYLDEGEDSVVKKTTKDLLDKYNN